MHPNTAPLLGTLKSPDISLPGHLKRTGLQINKHIYILSQIHISTPTHLPHPPSVPEERAALVILGQVTEEVRRRLHLGGRQQLPGISLLGALLPLHAARLEPPLVEVADVPEPHQVVVGGGGQQTAVPGQGQGLHRQLTVLAHHAEILVRQDITCPEGRGRFQVLQAAWRDETSAYRHKVLESGYEIYEARKWCNWLADCTAVNRGVAILMSEELT